MMIRPCISPLSRCLSLFSEGAYFLNRNLQARDPGLQLANRLRRMPLARGVLALDILCLQISYYDTHVSKRCNLHLNGTRRKLHHEVVCRNTPNKAPTPYFQTSLLPPLPPPAPLTLSPPNPRTHPTTHPPSFPPPSPPPSPSPSPVPSPSPPPFFSLTAPTAATHSSDTPRSTLLPARSGDTADMRPGHDSGSSVGWRGERRACRGCRCGGVGCTCCREGGRKKGVDGVKGGVGE